MHVDALQTELKKQLGNYWTVLQNTVPLNLIESAKMERIDQSDYGIIISRLANHVTVDGLAWDWATKKVYWSDAGRKRIEVYDPLRNTRQLLKSTGSQSLPRDIAVDPTTG